MGPDEFFAYPGPGGPTTFYGWAFLLRNTLALMYYVDVIHGLGENEALMDYTQRTIEEFDRFLEAHKA